MSTRDEEIEDEIIREEPEEEIERHSKPHDSYRELPSNDDVVDMVQPPLEPQIEELEEELATTMKAAGLTSDGQNNEPEELKPSEEVAAPQEVVTDAPAEEQVVAQEVPPVLTQEIMLEETLPVVDGVRAQEEVTPVVAVEPAITEQPPTQDKVQEPQAPSQIHTEYHTVSGGPETIHELAAAHRSPLQNAPLNTTEYPSTAAASGYSIPNPNYPATAPTDLQTQSNFGSFFFLVVLAIIGGAITYVYFYMPQTFDQVFDALVIIKNQLLKQ